VDASVEAAPAQFLSVGVIPAVRLLLSGMLSSAADGEEAAPIVRLLLPGMLPCAAEGEEAVRTESTIMGVAERVGLGVDASAGAWEMVGR